MSQTKVLHLESLRAMLKIIDRRNMKMDKLLLDDMEEEALNTNQRQAGLQHQAHQPRLAMKADVQEDKKTRESTEDFAQDGILGDISYDRVYDPMRFTSFGDKYYIEPPALPCRDDALVNQGHEVAKPFSHPWTYASQHPPAAFYIPAQLQTPQHKGPTFSHNFLGASVRRARRRKFLRQDRHLPSTTVPGTQR